MAEQTAIAWCDSTFNPWMGCTKVSQACDHCYAEVSTPARALGISWGPTAERRRTTAANWGQPLRWHARRAEFETAHNRRRRVFCASLADVFDNAVDPQWRQDLFELIRATPSLDWLLLTKRIGNAPSMLPPDWGAGWRNVWLGATVCNQAEADRDVPKLLSVPAAIHWLSVEPLLSRISLNPIWLRSDPFETQPPRRVGSEQVDWVVVGGESGPNARPMHPIWPRDLRDQCREAGVPFLFKQHGEWLPLNEVPTEPGRMVYASDSQGELHSCAAALMKMVGRTVAGRHLDGQLHDAFPIFRQQMTEQCRGLQPTGHPSHPPQ
ncbi:phage Gp37/Gp68 family protein [Cupriavidus sp. D39]|uniref:phage Gp37/Gp68 family protein n=1 Tax=Cupriavidus sp. D39 TaxID=2997877 RepID=UPI00226F0FE4|nr:phage Gp37/Gp68 family protein [Cupriavidus sp. D39]MCY0852429.1 phage Gp37/Gp68 family protein [Cupriavidus sp. D39]